MRAWSRQEQFAGALLAFAVALTAFLLLPPFLMGDVGSIRGFTWQEAADLFTSIVAMPLLALAIVLTGRSGVRVGFAFLVLAAAWVEGQGIHLAANAIGDVFPAGAERQLFYATGAGPLDHFLDEGLGHWLWHGAWAGLLFLLLWASASGPTDRPAPSRLALQLAALAGIVHGFTWFVVTDEGGTWPMSILVSALLLAAAVLVRRRDGRWGVATTFLAIAAPLTIALYAGWALIAGWPPVGFCDRFGC